MRTQFAPNTVLKQFREDLGLSQAELGESIGSSAPVICNAELGRRRLGADIAMRIYDRYRRECIAAGISVEDLLRPGR